MTWVLPLIVAVPFAGAALGVATDRFLPAWVKQYPALLFSIATAVLAGINLVHLRHADTVYWFGGWKPHHSIAIGISFVSEPFGAGLALLVAILGSASLLFSWHYLEDAPGLYRVLMLVFLG